MLEHGHDHRNTEPRQVGKKPMTSQEQEQRAWHVLRVYDLDNGVHLGFVNVIGVRGRPLDGRARVFVNVGEPGARCHVRVHILDAVAGEPNVHAAPTVVLQREVESDPSRDTVVVHHPLHAETKTMCRGERAGPGTRNRSVTSKAQQLPTILSKDLLPLEAMPRSWLTKDQQGPGEASFAAVGARVKQNVAAVTPSTPRKSSTHLAHACRARM